jgi:predicted PurR-regulated permease PerM
MDADTHQHGPGPITWCGIIAVTCGLLFIFQKILWLVVPFMLALVLYYLLAPLAQRLVLAGFSKDFAAGALSGAFLLLLATGLLVIYPWALANVEGWHDTFMRYLAGGYTLIDGALSALEKKFRFASNIHLAELARTKFTAMQDHFAEEYLGAALLALGEWLPSLLLIPVITYFLLKEGTNFRKFLGKAVPNAYFEKTLYLSYAIDRTARAYFLGLVKLTLIDGLMLTIGFAVIGLSSPVMLGVSTALIGQVPYVGPLLGCLAAILVTGTDFPGHISLAYGVMGLFLLVRLLDDLVFIPAIVGKSLRLHPLLSLLMLLVGGAIAGIAGLMLVLPVMGVTLLLGETLELILTDIRLRARHAFSVFLRKRAAEVDLTSVP